MAKVSVRRRKNRSGEQGQAILELVPVILLLLALTFAVIDFGHAIWQYEVITGLTREGSNLASRSTSLQDAATAVLSDGSTLNLSATGEVILTSVQNNNNQITILDQYVSNPSFGAVSRVGSVVGGAATLPATTPVVPQPGDTIYVTEIFSTYTPITPLGAFVSYTVPATLYDVAYF